jgi:hypothetical protein
LGTEIGRIFDWILFDISSSSNEKIGVLGPLIDRRKYEILTYLKRVRNGHGRSWPDQLNFYEIRAL